MNPSATNPAAMVPAALVPAALVPAALVPAALVPAASVPERVELRIRRIVWHDEGAPRPQDLQRTLAEALSARFGRAGSPAEPGGLAAQVSERVAQALESRSATRASE
jgi:hypothetical protein